MIHKRVFNKFNGNPILTADDFPDGIMYVLNPGAVYHNGEYILLVDAVTTALPIVLWIARSKDGINFKVDPEPVNWPESDSSHPECCVYDPRITKIDDEYIIMYASSGKYGVRVGIVKTKDFVIFERVAIASEQGNRNAVLFPEKINGQYVRLDRPMGDPLNDPASIWISYSDDLVHWGNSKPLLETRFALWDYQKVGAGAVPIKTKEGWLEIYHGVSDNCSGFIYRLGVCLLDLKDPSIVIARGEEPVLWPEHNYEVCGNVNNVVFTANAILEPDDTVKIYYGAADTCIGMAEAKLDDLIAACHTKNKHLEKFFKNQD
jgi:beta-1,4-mannooligosaccharide/beta-1,4-mannosyl-N-acetylglucosamine phosphorylase